MLRLVADAGRGGQGIANIDVSRGKKKSSVIAAFTVMDTDQIVMVADSGQIIRCPIDKVSIVGRSSRGVTIFKTAKGEEVVSVSRLRDVEDENGNGDGEADLEAPVEPAVEPPAPPIEGAGDQAEGE